MINELIEFLKKNAIEVISNIVEIEKTVDSRFEEFQALMKGTVTIEGQSISIFIAIPFQFPRELPDIFLEDSDALGFLPHIDEFGKVCFVQNEGTFIDQDYPGQLVVESIQKSILTIAKGVTGQNNKDFIDEFESYWIRQPNVSLVHSVVKETEVVKIVSVWSSDEDNLLVVADSEFEACIYIEKIMHSILSKTSAFSAIFVPLDNHNEIYPPKYNENWSAAKVREIVATHISEKNRKELVRCLKKKLITKAMVGYILLSIPHVKEGNTLIGFYYSLFNQRRRLIKSGKKNLFWTHPLNALSGNSPLKPISFIRAHHDRLRTRGGANTDLQNKHIVIVGVGSVGSRIAIEMVRAGVNKLSFVDPDFLSLENIYRHELGADKVYQRVKSKDKRTLKSNAKTKALIEEIKSKFPHTQLYEYQDKFEDVLENDLINLNKVDLVIIATGDPTGEVFINRYLHKLPNSPPTIFSWVEPLGIGGHALLTLNNKRKGCFRCLLRSESIHGSLYNKASFALPEQSFVKVMSGCSTVYTPFGSLDALQTAILTTRLAINVLNGNETDNPLLSWKGNPEQFLESGYKLSNRYLKSSVEDLFNYRYQYKESACSVCGYL